MVGEPIEKCGGHLGIAEDAGPFTEAQVGGDDDASALVKFAEHSRTEMAGNDGYTSF